MADFDTSAAKAASIKKAANILPNVQAAFEAEDLLALYMAGTDATYNAMVSSLFTGAERTKLAAIGNDATALRSSWQATYPPIFGL